jgi:tripartite-type tricarboxylate transporter receptor subunit TctC
MMRLLLGPILAVAMFSGAAAQSGSESRWPDKPIRMIVPLPAGSAVDIVARLICTKLSERIGQTIVIDNRSGASGAIASDVVAKSAPDGYTLGMATSTTHVTTAILNSKLPYDPVKDFVPVALIGIVPYVLAVSPQLPAKNLSELLALAKAKPGTLNYSSVGLGSLAHLATEMMSTMAGIKLNHIPYRASGPAILDMSENRIDLSIGVLGTFLSLIRDGKIHALAVTTEASLWFAVVAPAAIPQPVLARLNKEINAILAEPEIKKSLAAQAVDVETSDPENLRSRIRADIEKWRDIAAKAGVKSE